MCEGRSAFAQDAFALEDNRLDVVKGLAVTASVIAAGAPDSDTCVQYQPEAPSCPPQQHVMGEKLRTGVEKALGDQARRIVVVGDELVIVEEKALFVGKLDLIGGHGCVPVAGGPEHKPLALAAKVRQVCKAPGVNV